MSRNQPSDEQLSFTVASVWREERVSCPHPDILSAYQSGGLEAGARDFIRFHLEQSQCPYCNAVLEDLRSAERALPDLDRPLREHERFVIVTRIGEYESKIADGPNGAWMLVPEYLEADLVTLSVEADRLLIAP